MKKHRTVTKYQHIKELVLSDISSGRYGLSERLPSERTLAVHYGVNRLTVNRALGELVDENWLYRVNGSGTYVSNTIHSKLAKRETCNIHLLTVSLRRSIDVSFSHYALSFFRKLPSVNFTVHESGFDAEHEFNLMENLLKDSDSLVFIIGFCNPATVDLIRQNANRCVILGSAPELSGQAIEVHTDFEAGGRMIMTHLLNKGHHRIAYCGDTTTGEMPGRFHAWQAVLQENKLPAPEEYVLSSASNYDMSDQESKVNFVRESLLHFLNLPKIPSAIFCSNDDLASIMIQQCWQLGLQVPEDLSICGFDGSVSDAMSALNLTTVRQPYEEIFKTAFNLLKKQKPEKFPKVILKPEMIEGKTSAEFVETAIRNIQQKMIVE